MAFNFGDKPFKHSLPKGYQPVMSVPPTSMVINKNNHGGSTAASSKILNNAPQAIIIEVGRFFFSNVFNS